MLAVPLSPPLHTVGLTYTIPGCIAPIVPHDGRNLSQETKDAIIDAIDSGATLRETASAYKVSPHTVQAVTRYPKERTELTSTGLPKGQWASWKDTTATSLESIVARQTRQYSEALDDGKINPHTLPVHMGIFIDKISQLRSEQAAIGVSNEPGIADMLGELKAIGAPVTVNIQVNNHGQKAD